MKDNRKCLCPICGFKGYKYEYWTEYGIGVVERHGYCDRCGYTVEQAYSGVIDGFMPDITRGYKDYQDNYHPKNTRKRTRMRRKYNIKRSNRDYLLQFI